MQKLELIIITFISLFSLAFCQDFPAMIANGFTLPPIGPRMPIALETWSIDGLGNGDQRFSKYTGNFAGCSDTAATLCNQGAWADFGLAVSGLIPKYNLCTKYSPSTSCVSSSLSHCNTSLSEITNTMMIAFGRVVVSWCYDGGLRLTALDTYATCLSVSMFDALTIRNCLTQIHDPNAVGKPTISNDVTDPQKSILALPKLFNNVIDTYQSSTIVCMHSAIVEACGQEAATLALGPAMDELMVPSPVETSSPSPSTTESASNDSIPREKDMFSKSRHFMDKDYANSSSSRVHNWLTIILMNAITIIASYCTFS